MRKRWLIPLVLLCLAVSAAIVFHTAAPSMQTNVTSAADLGLILLDDTSGVSVLAVQDKSIADRAGIHPGDVLLQADGVPFSNVDDLDKLMQSNSAPILRMEILRSEEQMITVQLNLQPKIH